MLTKVKAFFKNLFGKNNHKMLDVPANSTENAKEKQLIDDTFKNKITIDLTEQNRILKLQKDFRAGLIKEEDISDEDYEALSNLYDKQIEETKQEIQNYKNKIIALKSKLTQNN